MEGPRSPRPPGAGRQRHRRGLSPARRGPGAGCRFRLERAPLRIPRRGARLLWGNDMQAGVPEGRALGLRLERANRDGARTLVSDMFERGDALALFHAPGSHFNRVRGFGLESPVSAADLAAIEAFYAAH